MRYLRSYSFQITFIKEVFESGRSRAKPTWIRVAALDDADCLALWARLRLVTDPGEAEAIPLARQYDVPILIDDQGARGHCDLHRIPCLSLHEALTKYLTPKRCKAVIDAVRRESGFLIVEPEY
ncbi:MAG TPA: hypothetical protein VIJ12_08050 [Candidatus Baltobacteraceae bacterium]